MTDLPKTVQWVLDFLNINNTPGKPDLYRLPYELRNLKRPPIPKDLSKLMPISSGYRDADTGYEWKNIKKPKKINIYKLEMQLQEIRDKKKLLLQRKLPDKKEEEIEKLIKQQEEEIISALNNRDKRSEVIKTLNPAKDLKFVGINNDPTLEDFKQFFLKEGIPPLKGKELILENGKHISSLDGRLFDDRPKNNSEPGYYAYHDNRPIEYGLYLLLLETVWGELSRILSNKVWGTKTRENEGTGYAPLLSYLRHIRKLHQDCLIKDKKRFEGTEFGKRVSMVINSIEYEKPLPHYGMLPTALYARVLDLRINHEKLCSRLKQCPCCGSFFIVKEKKKPKKYCDDKCKAFFKPPSRQDDREAKKVTREEKKDNLIV